MTMSVEPLSPALGAEIKGVDLRRPLDDAAVKAINAAFDQHVVVVFRDQDLSEADQLRAAGYFGKVHIRRRPANGRRGRLGLDSRHGRGSGRGMSFGNHNY